MHHILPQLLLILSMTMCACSTVRVWASGECTGVLEGHEGAVQCVRFLPDGRLATGSNDTTIRVWSGAKCEHVIRGHTDTVRCASRTLGCPTSCFHQCREHRQAHVPCTALQPAAMSSLMKRKHYWKLWSCCFEKHSLKELVSAGWRIACVSQGAMPGFKA